MGRSWVAARLRWGQSLAYAGRLTALLVPETVLMSGGRVGWVVPGQWLVRAGFPTWGPDGVLTGGVGLPCPFP